MTLGPRKLGIEFIEFYIFNPMNKLPREIQNEIYEFARGDRAYWKRTFKRMWSDFFDLDVTLVARNTCNETHFIDVVTDVHNEWIVAIFDNDDDDKHAIRLFPLVKTKERAIKLMNIWSNRRW